ncbi:hypothetical protein [uncultured Shimia sp.]|uniref:hypothetical protein n=1 Tax=uncultured Shimia sp. TaxID=573152 RepID=UPI002639E6A0|nr:hypothetical protein [uncultured Shimia sp.]
MKLLFVSLMCLSIAACATFPVVDERTKNDVAAESYLEMVPLETILQPPEARLEETSEEQLEGRINGLKQRAKILQEQEVE